MSKLYATTGTERSHLIRTITLTARNPRTWCLRDLPDGCGLAEYKDTMPNLCPACSNAFDEAVQAKAEVAKARAVLDAAKPVSVTSRRR